jgi:lauroyl/myristoyl acyltransferase
VLRYAAFHAALWLCGVLPRRLIYAVAAVIALAAWVVNAPARRICADNVRQALGPTATAARVRRCVLGCFRAATYYYADLGRTPRMDPSTFFERNLRLSGFEHVEQAVAQGRGVIIATIHYGNPEYVAQSVSARGYHFLALTEPLKPRALAKLFQELRDSQGQQFVEVGMAGMKATLRHLKQGGIVCIICDRDIQGTGEDVLFFGKRARIPSGAIDLARHTGAVILPAVTRRRGLDCFDLYVQPPFELQREGRWQEDRRRNTESLIQRFEPYLRRDPSQWTVLEERIWDADAPPSPSSLV